MHPIFKYLIENEDKRMLTYVLTHPAAIAGAEENPEAHRIFICNLEHNLQEYADINGYRLNYISDIVHELGRFREAVAAKNTPFFRELISSLETADNYLAKNKVKTVDVKTLVKCLHSSMRPIKAINKREETLQMSVLSGIYGDYETVVRTRAELQQRPNVASGLTAAITKGNMIRYIRTYMPATYNDAPELITAIIAKAFA